uniref:Putative secreted peptide n=1 Tax=Anopheles braziliensis TaxID=58242 RepID=A0A2M3ZMT1_9DIPT
MMLFLSILFSAFFHCTVPRFSGKDGKSIDTPTTTTTTTTDFASFSSSKAAANCQETNLPLAVLRSVSHSVLHTAITTMVVVVH